MTLKEDLTVKEKRERGEGELKEKLKKASFLKIKLLLFNRTSGESLLKNAKGFLRTTQGCCNGALT